VLLRIWMPGSWIHPALRSKQQTITQMMPPGCILEIEEF
jgi:hypothetical protein